MVIATGGMKKQNSLGGGECFWLRVSKKTEVEEVSLRRTVMEINMRHLKWMKCLEKSHMGKRSGMFREKKYLNLSSSLRLLIAGDRLELYCGSP